MLPRNHFYENHPSICLLFGSLFLNAISCSPPYVRVSAKIVDKIVAQVNDEIITLSELEQAMKYSKANPDSPSPLKTRPSGSRCWISSLTANWPRQKRNGMA